MGWRKRGFFRKHFLSHRKCSMTLKPRLTRNISPPTEIQVLLGAGVEGVPPQRNRVNFKTIIFITNSRSNTYANFAKILFFGMKSGFEVL